MDSLSEEDAADLLDYAESLLDGDETLTDEEIARVQAGEAEIARGETTSWDELRRELNL